MLNVSYKNYRLLCANCRYGIRDNNDVYICSKKEHMGYFDEDSGCEGADIYSLLNEAVSEAEINEDLEKDISSIVHNMVGNFRAGFKEIEREILKAYRKQGYDTSYCYPRERGLDIAENLR